MIDGFTLYVTVFFAGMAGLCAQWVFQLYRDNRDGRRDD